MGRPVLWGLAHSGEQGVKKVLQILIHELSNTMGLVGTLQLIFMFSNKLCKLPRKYLDNGLSLAITELRAKSSI